MIKLKLEFYKAIKSLKFVFIVSENGF
ncbi:hypothetical protein CY0110_16177 [Crocosphaera chwakensis CCY0110]|uniref:Uncharacterized protein n=1 Tax=Crocosphaera chwakensis CCY0110 TaxID=391612 RepID=A3IHR7_9CHRO|nr:hypothetical protein CY0110_16177 [Crocosphaera chwakensis CCY0110]